MKGDITRLTFDSKKHYSSVRMQQGRLQLDSDWNEQVDIQNYLRRAQILASIGSDSGVPSYNPETGEPSTDSFKLKIIADGEDLQINPGHLYIRGTLCELELGTPFTANIKGSEGGNSQVEVSSLVVDGRKFEQNQWIEEVVPESQTQNPPTQPTIYQIENVDIEKRLLTLKAFPESSTDTQPDQQKTINLRRLLTYNTQTDYPNPEQNLTSGIYFAYIDVWERHITTIEDSSIREIALNIPDTTTRSKTVWQLKLRKIKEEEEIREEAEKQLLDFVNAIEVPEGKQEEKKTLIDDLNKIIKQQQKIPDSDVKNFKTRFNQLTDIDEQQKNFKELLTRHNKIDDEVISQSDKVWGNFVNSNQTGFTEATMNACARLCTNIGASASSTTGYQRLENQLYRVEIHDRGRIGTAKLATEPLATFKWSRENGSIVSSIIRIEGNTITIPKSSQDAWSSSQPGQQWIEITNEERESKGKPGVLARLTRIISDTKIEFGSPTTNLPENPTKVRRWEVAAIEIKSKEWIELEGGIKVKFSSDLYYETGDYWVIPARTAINDIEWPDDGGEPAKPIPQPPRGIKHDYSLLALVKINNQDKFEGFDQEEQQQNEQDNQQNKQELLDRRTIFPSLQNSFDKETGGTIKGDVNIGTSDKNASLLVVGEATIEQATSVATKQGEALVGSFAENGHKANLKVAGAVALGTDTLLNQLDVAGAVAIGEQYAGSQAAPENGLLVDGNISVGTENNQNKLDVAGAVAIGEQYAGSQAAPENGLLVDGNISVGTENNQNKLDVAGAVAIGEQYAGSQAAPTDGLLVEGNVWIGSQAPEQPEEVKNAKLYLKGDLCVDGEEVGGEIREGRIFAKNINARNFRGTNFTQISSNALKEEITDLHSQEVTEILKALNPVKFIYKEDEAQIPHAGFIAEDTPDLLTSSDKQEIKVFDMVAVLTKAVKDQQKVTNKLVNVVKIQQNLISGLTKKLEELEKKLDSVNKSMK